MNQPTPSTTTATPLTDAQPCESGYNKELVAADFARDLERRLTAALSELEYTRGGLIKSQAKCATLRADLERAREERDRLKDWKESAMSVSPPLQEIGRALDLRLGQSVHDKILPGILTLRSELDASQKEVAKKQSMIETHCVDWAEDDTAIKAVCAKFGIREDDNPGYFKSSVECVDELAVLLDASLRREGVLRDALKAAESALANSYDVTEWPATPDCQAQLALNEVRSALGAGSEEGRGE